MIPPKIIALFEFIDYLDVRKADYIGYIPLSRELDKLHMQRAMLKPKSNYIEKQKYDSLQKEISKKFEPIIDNIYLPILSKLKELGIWSGDDTYASIWNNNISAISNFKDNFESDDVAKVMTHKQKYLSFRTETNNNLLCLGFVFESLDEIYKTLFDFFTDNPVSDFQIFETKLAEVSSIAEALRRFDEGDISKFVVRRNDLFEYQNVRKYYPKLYAQPQITKTEIIMGHNITGDGNILNTGDKARVDATITVNKGNYDSLKSQLSSYGIEDNDIAELMTLLKVEKPNSNTSLGKNVNDWILKIVGKGLSGVGKITTGISSNILATLIKQFYGIDG